MRFARRLVQNPHRTALVLISDFFEGSDPRHLLGVVRTLSEMRVKLIGLAALDDKGQPEFDRAMAQRLAGAGMRVGSMSPIKLGQWLAEVMQS